MAKIAAMEAKIEEGLASGVSDKSVDEVMADAWKAAQA